MSLDGTPLTQFQVYSVNFVARYRPISFYISLLYLLGIDHEPRTGSLELIVIPPTLSMNVHLSPQCRIEHDLTQQKTTQTQDTNVLDTEIRDTGGVRMYSR